MMTRSSILASERLKERWKDPEFRAKMLKRSKRPRKTLEERYPDGVKVCTGCEQLLTLNDFYPHKTRQGMPGLNPRCKDCVRRKTRERNRRVIHGISSDRYTEMLLAQDNKCHICFIELDESKSHAGGYLDHDHKSGAVRSILCSQCNFLLGQARDDVGILSRAIEYLGEYSD
jgi:uncharacterized CHY-type Zn-finger protein